ncbi:MAG: extracellular solute-binding protein [Spirochaetales bacterium]|nr:extracellular solute-binding protein [Spirochaetales bacterium]
MKKLIALLVVAAMITGMLFAQGASEGEAATAAKKGELTIYSAASQAEAEKLTEAFNKIHPEIKVTIISAGSGDIVTRIKTEWPKPDGDVVLLLGAENLDQVYDMLAEYKSANHDAIDPDNRDQKSATPKYYGTSMPLQAIMINTNIFKNGDGPKSWKDLGDPKYKGQLVLANPASSGSAYAQLYMMNKLYGMDFVKTVVANATYVASSTAGPDSVARGEYGITVTGEFNIANKIAAGDPVAYVLPEEGTGRRIEGSAILANCKNPESAKLFIDFMTSPEGFEVVRSECNRRAASTNAAAPNNLPALKDMKFFTYDAVEAKTIKKKLVSEFQGLL